VIAPPSVLLRPGEEDDLLNDWRVARWYAADPESMVITPGEYIKGSYQAVTSNDVGLMLPAEFSDWVSRVCERQRALADGFGRRSPGLAPREDHARAAAELFRGIVGSATARRHATDELWCGRDDMPDNVDELLELASGRPRSARPAVIASATSSAHEAADDCGDQPFGAIELVVSFLVAVVGAAILVSIPLSGAPHPAWRLLGLFLVLLALCAGEIRRAAGRARLSRAPGEGVRLPPGGDVDGGARVF